MRFQVFVVTGNKHGREPAQNCDVSVCRKYLTRFLPMRYKPLIKVAYCIHRRSSFGSNIAIGVPVEGFKIQSCLCARGNRYMKTLQNVSFFSIRRGYVLGFLSLLVALACCSPSWAQMTSQGTVTVAVVDSTGGAVQGA